MGIVMVPNAFAQDRGDFYLTYEPTAIYSTFEDWLKDKATFEDHVENLNYIFQLPDNVEIIIADSSYYSDCQSPNAFYGDKQILICYELIYDTDYRFTQYYEREYGYDLTTEQLLEIDNATLHLVESVLYHELGHALIDIYDLPITGLEEDVADQFAAYYVLDFHYEDDPENLTGQNIMLDTAWDYWLISEQYPDIHPSAFADTHSLDKQRFYNLACWTYGAYPNDSQWMLDQRWVAEDRAEYWCEDEYQQIVQFWNCQPVFQEGVMPVSKLSSCQPSSGGFDPSGIIFLVIVSVIIGVVIAVIKSRRKTPIAPLVQQPKITCRNCYHLNRSTSNVCAKCGNNIHHIYSRIKGPIKGKNKPKIICHICKQPNRSTSKICGKCGNSI